MSNTADNIRDAITKTLAEAGVTFSATYSGERKNALDGHAPMDAWRCEFKRPELGHVVAFEFYAGFGHRELPEWGRKPPRPGSLLHAQWVAQAKPGAPSPADVLVCLIRDAEACDQSFESWCSDLSYDTDSRKAFATYEACQRNGDKLRGFFKRSLQAQFSRLLQDY
jgi:hypothetical protein